MNNDPSGHYVCNSIADGKCINKGNGDTAAIVNETIFTVLDSFTNVNLSGDFTRAEKAKIARTLIKLRDAHGGMQEFFDDLGNFSIHKNKYHWMNVLGYVPPWGKNKIYLDEQIFLQENYMSYIAHEVGHVFDFKNRVYKSQSFITAFSKDSCGGSGSLGCIGLNSEKYQKVIWGYRFLEGDFKYIYDPKGTYSRPYSKVSSIDDFADSYAVVTIGINNEFKWIDDHRRSLMNLWISQ